MNESLRAHQRMMLEMLTEVDRICKKHEISYMLFAGTLLGAVRHNGFIPWDDDLDIVMLRPEYERFLEAAAAELDPERYYLQGEFSSHWPMFFSKLRRNGTACIERYRPKDRLTHMGVYIDIFPCDNLRENPLLRKLQFLCSKVVIAKALNARGYATANMGKKAFLLLAKLAPKRPLVAFVQNRKGSASKLVHTFFGAASKYSKNIYPREWLCQTVPVTFEGHSFPAPVEYHAVLTQMYGEYMVPIPEAERAQKVHGELVDLERSYEEYWEMQQNLKFTEYSRSIR